MGTAIGPKGGNEFEEEGWEKWAGVYLVGGVFRRGRKAKYRLRKRGAANNPSAKTKPSRPKRKQWTIPIEGVKKASGRESQRSQSRHWRKRMKIGK